MGLPISKVRPGDWDTVRRNFDKIKSNILGPNANVTHAGLTLTGLTASQLLQTDANKKLASIALPLIVSKGGTGAATLTDHSILLGSGTAAVTALGAATNGQLPIGSTGADPVLAGITGTSNRITVTNGAGSITLTAPQDLHTGATNFTVAGATISGLTAGSVLFAGTGGILSQDNSNLFWDDTNKRLGIGTASPEASLHIFTTEGIRIGYPGGSRTLDIVGTGTGATAPFEFRTNSAFKWKVDSITRLGITDDGYVGIGIDAPDARLHINGSNSGNTLKALKLQNDAYSDNTKVELAFTTDTIDTAEQGLIVVDTKTYGDRSGDMGFWTNNAGSVTEKLSILANGYIGIGETSPETLTEWTGTAPYLTLHNSTHEDTNGGGESRLIFKREDGAGTKTACFQFEASHDGAVANDQLGKMVLSVNTGAGLVQALEIGSDLLATFAGSITSASDISTKNTASQGYVCAYDQSLASCSLMFHNGTGAIISTNTGSIWLVPATGSSIVVGGDGLIPSADGKALGATSFEFSTAYINQILSDTGAVDFGNENLTTTGTLILAPDEITATSDGVAASVATLNTEVTTNGDSDLDNVTLANGTSGQIKHIYCVAEGNAADTWKITPATMCGGTQITFSGVGKGCTLVYADNEGWVVVANNGGTIS